MVIGHSLMSQALKISNRCFCNFHTVTCLCDGGKARQFADGKIVRTRIYMVERLYSKKAETIITANLYHCGKDD